MSPICLQNSPHFEALELHLSNSYDLKKNSFGVPSKQGSAQSRLKLESRTGNFEERYFPVDNELKVIAVLVTGGQQQISETVCQICLATVNDTEEEKIEFERREEVRAQQIGVTDLLPQSCNVSRTSMIPNSSI
ncbi:hypothetical protein ACLB2K_022413 [Fragaria x ananassa]